MAENTKKSVVYRCKCNDCKYEWTSRAGYGTPDYCPKCRSVKIAISPMPGA